MQQHTESPNRVSSFENDEVGGLALSCEPIFQDRISQAKKLRERQAAYLATLPTDPTEVVRASLKLMNPNGNNYPEGIEEALHLSTALAALFRGDDPFDSDRTYEAAMYIAERVSDAMHEATNQLDHVSDILCNPARNEKGA